MKKARRGGEEGKKEGRRSGNERRKEASVFVASYVPGTLLSTFRLIFYLIPEQPLKESPLTILQMRKQRPR